MSADELRTAAGPTSLDAMRLALMPARAGRAGYAARLVLAGAVAAAATGTSGCAINTGQPGGGRVQLVSALADRLERAGSLTYTAAYRLPQGDTATISQAQNPGRAAYTYPGGKLILTPGATADCRTQDSVTTCTLTAPPSPGTDPATALVDGIAVRGVIAPVVVIGLLTAAAVDADALVTTHDTTLAGQSATCVDIQGVRDAASSEFDVCVTPDGVLASFAGTVAGAHVDIHLDRYDQIVAPDAFDLPPGATIIDQRAK
jgi:hypothetical protein